MFKKLAADLTGFSDIGQVIHPDDFDKAAADDYVLHEDGEKIYFLIKSKSDEYCFTNLALIHLDGESAVSSKRVLIAIRTHTIRFATSCSKRRERSILMSRSNSRLVANIIRSTSIKTTRTCERSLQNTSCHR